MLEFYGVPYSVVASKKRKRSIGFHITASGLEVRIPYRYDEKRLLPILEKRKNWIVKCWEKEKKREKIVTLESGLNDATPFILYFGEKFPIESFEYDKKSTCLFDGESLRVYIKSSQKSKEKEIVRQWYKKEANLYLPERTRELAKLHHFSGLRDIFIKSYKTKYGVCKGKDVYFDYKLMSLPKEIIDHIILHELTHLIHKHHQASFRKKLSELDPNWKKNRDFLRGKIDTD